MKKRTAKSGAGRRGFTILESLVAIAILLVALTGPMVFAQQSLRASRLAGDQITAFYLAQDAIELVKHIRDQNSLYLYREEWLAGLERCLASESVADGGCQLSSSEWTEGNEDAAVVACAANCWLYEQNGFFGIFGKSPSAGSPTENPRFSRRVKIMAADGGTLDPTSSDEALVEVDVSWSTLGVSTARHVLVREHIYNWIQ